MDKVSAMPDADFIAAWNTAASFDEAVERVRQVVGNVPRWAVLARASGLRRRGVGLRHHETRGRAG